MIRFMLTAVALAVAGAAAAKLPAPDEAAKAKAAEAAAKTAWQGKVDAYKLCQVQDRVAAYYKSHAPAKPAVAPGTAPAAPAAPTMTPTAAPAAAAPVAAAPAATAAAKPPVPTAASASQGGSTPVAAVAPNPPAPGCADPGPFAYAPAEQKPLETSGAHSPAANATSPPSVRAEAATMTPSKPSVATKP